MHGARRIRGNFVLTTHGSDVFAADQLSSTPHGIEVGIGGLVSGTVDPLDLSEIFQVECPVFPADQIRESQKLSATIYALEQIIEAFAREKGISAELMNERRFFAIFGASSLSLTVMPLRTSDDIDLLAPSEFVDFVNQREFPRTEMAVEVLPPEILNLMGQWHSRSCAMRGYHGVAFDIMHPLDTVIQKLLRMNEGKFQEKDVPDIEAIVEKFQPPRETLTRLLTENPFRYYKVPVGPDEQRTAVERNTTWFLSRFMPDCSYESLVEGAVIRTYDAVRKIDAPEEKRLHVKKLADFDLEGRIRLVRSEDLKNDFRLP